MKEPPKIPMAAGVVPAAADRVLFVFMGLGVEKCLHHVECLLLGSVEVVVDEDAVELRCEGHFVGGLGDALVDGFGGVGWMKMLSARSP